MNSTSLFNFLFFYFLQHYLLAESKSAIFELNTFGGIPVLPFVRKNKIIQNASKIFFVLQYMTVSWALGFIVWIVFFGGSSTAYLVWKWVLDTTWFSQVIPMSKLLSSGSQFSINLPKTGISKLPLGMNVFMWIVIPAKD